MSRSPFVITLLLSGTMVSWFYVRSESGDADRSAGAATRSMTRRYGYPDRRGIVLQMSERPIRRCAASAFRAESPDVAVWDDGTVVFRTSTFDYRRGRISTDQARQWVRTFQVYSLESEFVACEKASDPSLTPEIQFWGRVDGTGASLRIQNLSSERAGHTESCADCRPIRPLVRMLREIDQFREKRENTELMTGLPVEVFLQWRSCGCRNHPEIVDVSKEWPLAGEKPAERCGKDSVRFRLEDPREIRVLSEAIARSAAVLDRGEIYTCFMRPLLEPAKEKTLALR